MRVILLLLGCLSISGNVLAVEPVDEQQIMFYYHIPLGADKQHSKHQFGLRFDQTSHDPRVSVQINALQTSPAVMDFKMGYDGVQEINIRGVDYAKYLIAKAAEGEETPVESTDETAGAATETAEDTSAGTETAQTEEETAPEEVDSFSKTITEMPVGIIIGAFVGIIIFSGVGG